MNSIKPLVRSCALLFTGALLATLIIPLATRSSWAGQQSFTLAPGDTITLSCPTKLSGQVRGQQSAVRCAATAATATATIAATATRLPAAPTATTVAVPTAAPAAPTATTAPGDPGAARTFLEPFSGQPAGPQPWKPASWDVTVHSRDIATWEQLEPIEAMHGSDCSPEPARHMISSYDESVFQCRDHLMTAIKAEGYGVIYLTPNQMVDFSGGEAVVRFDLSTLRTSQRDWVDLWISPYQDQLQLPLEDWLPDLQGEPRNAVHVRMDLMNNGTGFRAAVIKNFATTDLPGNIVAYESVLTPDAKRRDTFELRISRTHIRFGMPGYNLAWVDANIADLGWDRGVVQFGHHSYNPAKSDGCGSICQPNTWHWDNISISPALPFTLLRADRRVVDPTTAAGVTFAAPAPANANLRFVGIGSAIEASFDGGATWQAATPQAQKLHADDHFSSYWMPLPAGVVSVQFRGTDWWGGKWQVRDLSIWAQ
ncbi:hypothetical protein [Kouleothrix sp.]|uniref:hypothetical protein n=1 Tax=Kouleothrix sp. TaxID=2779161 RepID=UPI00391928DF